MPSGRLATAAEIEAAVERALRQAQRAWGAISGARARPPSRLSALRRCNECLKAWSTTIVPELAWQMGRPVRYGGRVARFRGARALYDRHRRGGAGRRRATRQGRLQALYPTRTAGHRAGHRAVELSLPDRGQLAIVPGADGRQCRDPQARQPDAAGGRALRPAFGPPACRKGCSRTWC
jgi:hypothetical protein